MLVVLVVVFTPVNLHQAPDYFVPASAALAFDKLLGNEDAALAAMTNLAISGAIVFALYIFWITIYVLIHSRKRS